MATITVQTPFENEPFVLVWDNRKVSVKGTESSLMYWNYLKLQGLNGVFGHIVNLQDCFLTDLISALYSRTSKRNVYLDEETKKIVKSEAKLIRSIPEGVCT